MWKVGKVLGWSFGQWEPSSAYLDFGSNLDGIIDAKAIDVVEDTLARAEVSPPNTVLVRNRGCRGSLNRFSWASLVYYAHSITDVISKTLRGLSFEKQTKFAF